MANVLKLVLLAAVILFAVAIVQVIVWALKDRRPWPRRPHLGYWRKRDEESDCGSGCQWVGSVPPSRNGKRGFVLLSGPAATRLGQLEAYLPRRNIKVRRHSLTLGRALR